MGRAATLIGLTSVVLVVGFALTAFALSLLKELRIQRRARRPAMVAAA